MTPTTLRPVTEFLIIAAALFAAFLLLSSCCVCSSKPSTTQTATEAPSPYEAYRRDRLERDAGENARRERMERFWKDGGGRAMMTYIVAEHPETRQLFRWQISGFRQLRPGWFFIDANSYDHAVEKAVKPVPRGKHLHILPLRPDADSEADRKAKDIIHRATKLIKDREGKR